MSDRHTLRLVVAASEANPYAKTGGLADVTGALPQELAKLGHEVILLLPKYRSVDICGRPFQPLTRIPVQTPQGMIDASIEESVIQVTGNPAGVRVWAIRFDPYFDRTGLYQERGGDYADNLDRFVFFSRAIVETLVYLFRERNWKANILHLHDWQTALCSVYLKSVDQKRTELDGVKTVLTIHNLGYQGLFPGREFSKTGLPSSLFTLNGLEFYGSVNLLKGGILFSDYLTTVSPTYSREILTRDGGFGLDGALRTREDQMQGVLNGIDVDLWNPQTDPYLPVNYSANDLAGKLLCKRALQREFNLRETTAPLLAVIGRMTSQKGFDLLESVMPDLMSLDVQLVVLGTGEPAHEKTFKSLQERYRDRMGLQVGFDEGLAHRIEGGADMLLMPSRYEPCGLSQLYSLRYGTVPIVRATGGLVDTVVPVAAPADRDNRATGFHIEDHSPSALLKSIRYAVEIYKDRSLWNRLVEEGMKTDFSWGRSAKRYEELFLKVAS